MKMKSLSLLWYVLLLVSLFSFAGCSQVDGLDLLQGEETLQGGAPVAEVDFLKVPVEVMTEETEGEGLLQAGKKNYNLYGYHVLDKAYINAGDVARLPILDAKLFESKSNLYVETDGDTKGSVVEVFISDKMSEIYSEINASASVGYKNAVFGGEIKTEYSTESQTSNRQLFITCMQKHVINSVEYKGRDYDLFAMLSEEFKADVKRVDEGAMSAAKLFEEYGTHLILEYELGGRTRVNYNYTMQKNDDKESVKTTAEGTYKGITGEVELEEVEGISTFLSASKLKFQSFGGKSISGSNLKDLEGSMNGWLDTIDENQVLCGINDFGRSLKPIWEILLGDEYKTVRDKLQKEFTRQTASKPVFTGELDFFDTKNPYISDIIVVHGENEKDAMSSVDKGYKYVCVGFEGEEKLDANKGRRYYIYIAYLPSKIKNGAITDIKVDLGKDTVHKGYSKCPEDLNKNVGGEHVYLFYKKATPEEVVSPDTQYIREIRGQYKDFSSLPKAWTTPSTTKDLNSGAGGEYIYLMVKKY